MGDIHGNWVNGHKASDLDQRTQLICHSSCGFNLTYTPVDV